MHSSSKRGIIVVTVYSSATIIRERPGEDAIKDFISTLRTIEADELIKGFSQYSIKMQSQEKFCLPVSRRDRYGVAYDATMLYAWDIPRLAYLAVKYSNDYVTAKQPIKWGELVHLFREYDCGNTVIEEAAEESKNYIYQLLLGITAEQVPYQRLQLNSTWIREKFSRDYYILPESVKLNLQ